MTLELNKPYLVKRVASKNGVLHYLPLEAICDGITIGKPQLAKRVALKDGVLHYLMSDQKLDETTGKLIIGKPYFAKRVKQNADGTLHYVVSGKQCEEDEPEFCCQCERFITSSDQFPDELTCSVAISCGVSVNITLYKNTANEEIDYSPGCKTYGTGGGSGQNWSVWYTGGVSTITETGFRTIGYTSCGDIPVSTELFSEGYIVDVNLFCESTPCGDKWFANVVYSDLDTGSGTNQRAIAGYVELEVVSCDPLELSGQNTADCDSDSEYDHCGPDYPTTLEPYYGMATAGTNCDGATVTLSIAE